MKEPTQTGRNSSQTEADDEFSESRESLRLDLLADEDFRYGYAESFLNTRVAAQIKALREQRKLTQKQLGAAIGTTQEGISRLENVNYSAWKTETLRRLARALQTRLSISFEPFGSLLDEVERFGRENLERPTPDADEMLNEPRASTASGMAGTSDAVEVTKRSPASVVKIDTHRQFDGSQRDEILWKVQDGQGKIARTR